MELLEGGVYFVVGQGAVEGAVDEVEGEALLSLGQARALVHVEDRHALDAEGGADGSTRGLRQGLLDLALELTGNEAPDPFQDL